MIGRRATGASTCHKDSHPEIANEVDMMINTSNIHGYNRIEHQHTSPSSLIWWFKSYFREILTSHDVSIYKFSSFGSTNDPSGIRAPLRLSNLCILVLALCLALLDQKTQWYKNDMNIHEQRHEQRHENYLCSLVLSHITMIRSSPSEVRVVAEPSSSSSSTAICAGTVVFRMPGPVVFRMPGCGTVVFRMPGTGTVLFRMDCSSSGSSSSSSSSDCSCSPSSCCSCVA